MMEETTIDNGSIFCYTFTFTDYWNFMMTRVKKYIVLIILFAVIFAVVFAILSGGFRMAPSSDEAEMDALLEEIEKKYFGISPYWLKRYHITVTEEADVRKDEDRDGLTLFQEYSYLTDPFDPDSDQDNYTDGEEVRKGYSPTGNGRMDVNHDLLPDVWESQYGLSLAQKNYSGDPDHDGLPNYLEYAHGTNPTESDTDKDNYTDAEEIRNGYDPDAPGEARPDVRMTIAKLNVSAPIILSRNALEEALLEDLKNGMIRYPKTANPGQKGNSVISGHSSNYPWVKSSYNYILRDLNDVEIGDEIIITLTQRNSKVITYTYRVSAKNIVSPDDPRIFEETNDETLTVVTCWPLGTLFKRLIVKADLIR